MRTLAVIIKHPFRDFDYRVDLVKVEDDVTTEQVRIAVERAMLGPFEVIAITEKIDLDRKIVVIQNDTEEHKAAL